MLPHGLHTEGHRFFVAEDDAGEHVGELWLGMRHLNGADVVWVYDVRVDEARRGLGYGRLIMRSAEDRAREMGRAARSQRLRLQHRGAAPLRVARLRGDHPSDAEGPLTGPGAGGPGSPERDAPEREENRAVRTRQCSRRGRRSGETPCRAPRTRRRPRRRRSLASRSSRSRERTRSSIQP